MTYTKEEIEIYLEILRSYNTRSEREKKNRNISRNIKKL